MTVARRFIAGSVYHTGLRPGATVLFGKFFSDGFGVNG